MYDLVGLEGPNKLLHDDQAGAKSVLLKRGKWNPKNLERFQNSPKLIRLATLVKEKKLDELKREVKQAISEKQLNGFLSRSGDSYVPSQVIQKAIAEQLSTGVIDKVPLIKTLDLSGEMLDPIIEAAVEEDGFWDLKRRRWFSWVSAKQLLLDKLSDADKYYAWEIMQGFNWSIGHVEDVLSFASKDGKLSGFIDHGQMINVTTEISRDLTLRSPRAIETASTFFQSFFIEMGDDGIPIQTILHLFKLSQSQLDELISHLHQEGILETLLSEDGQRLLSLERILERIVRYILVLEPFPIQLLSKKLFLSSEVLEDILQKLEGVISAGELDSEKRFTPTQEALKQRLEEPVDMVAFSSVFGVSPAASLRLVQVLANAYGLRLVNKGTEVVGITDLEVFCQLDGTVYEQEGFADEPKFYRECMNCKRVVCASCYDSRESKSCPFCDNISQFILEFPRYCPSCGLTYLGVEGLQSSEECRLCGYAPLERGWNRPIDYPETENRKKIQDKLLSSTGRSIPLSALATVVGLPEELLEEEIIGMILGRVIHARIDLAQGLLIRSIEEEEKKCTICQGSDDMAVQCTQCNAVICQNCAENLQKVNAYFCIDCDGDLQPIASNETSN
ncbi:MAG: hypothetical protein ACFFGZ_05355 [Candidatus Thorarchaeota archaeon]